MSYSSVAFLACDALFVARYNIKNFAWSSVKISGLFKAFEFRKPCLKFGNSSKTACGCNVGFMISFCKFWEPPHFCRTGPNQVEIEV